MSSSFLDKLKYKKERVGVVVKDGKTYTKYIKARRFRLSSGFKYAVLWVFLLVVPLFRGGKQGSDVENDTMNL